MMQQTRRNFIIGLGTLLSTPAIVKAENLMKIAVIRNSVDPSIIYDPVLINIIKRYYINCVVKGLYYISPISEFDIEIERIKTISPSRSIKGNMDV